MSISCASDNLGLDLAHWASTRDPEALERVLAAAAEPAYLQAIRLLGRTADAEDAAQEALVQLVRSANQYDQRRPFRPWLAGFVHKASCRLLRSARRRQRHETAASRLPPQITMDEPTVDLELIRAALMDLPEKLRAAIELHYFAGLSQAETAASLGITEAACAARMSRARERLRKLLERQGIHSGSVCAITALVSAPTQSAPWSLASHVSTQALSGKLPTTTIPLTYFQSGIWLMSLHPFTVFVSIVTVAMVTTASLTLNASDIQPAAQIVTEEAISASKKFDNIARIPDHVPLALLIKWDVFNPFEDVKFIDGHFTLSPSLRRIVALDQTTTAAVEQELTRLYDQYRAMLTANPPTVTRPDNHTTSLEFSGIDADSRLLAERQKQLFNGLVAQGTLSRIQAEYIKGSLSKSLLGEVIQFIPKHEIGTRQTLTVTLKKTIEPDGKTPIFHVKIERSYSGGSSSRGDSSFSWPENVRVFLPFAGLMEKTPLPAMGTPPPVPNPVAVRTTNRDQVPLAFMEPDSNQDLLKGVIRPSQQAVAICDLNDQQSAAVSTAYTTIYNRFRLLLEAHRPIVTTDGPHAATMEFEDLSQAGAVLEDDANRALEPLVTNGQLSRAQATYLSSSTSGLMKNICFGFGKRLYRIKLAYTEESRATSILGVTLYTSTAREWTYREEFQRDTQSGSSGGSGGGIPERFRLFITFLPFAADEALPPPTPTPAVTSSSF